MLAFKAGQVCSHDRDIGGDWTHLVALRQGKETRLYVNGELSAVAQAPERTTFDLSNASPLFLGYGPDTYFKGALSDVRLYAGALDADAIHRHSQRTTS